MIVSLTCRHTLIPPLGFEPPVLTPGFKGILRLPVPPCKYGFLLFLLLARLTCGFTSLSLSRGLGIGTGLLGGKGGGGGAGNGGGGGGTELPPLLLLLPHFRFHPP